MLSNPGSLKTPARPKGRFPERPVLCGRHTGTRLPRSPPPPTSPHSLPGAVQPINPPKHRPLFTTSCPFRGRRQDPPFPRTEAALSVTPAPSSHGSGAPTPWGSGFHEGCSLFHRTDLWYKVPATSQLQGGISITPHRASHCPSRLIISIKSCSVSFKASFKASIFRNP